WRDRETPGSVELAVGRNSTKEVARKVERIDEAAALADDLVFAVGVLLCICDVDLSTEGGDVERRIAGWQAGIGERAGQARHLPVRIDHVDPAVVEVRSQEVRSGTVLD